MSPAAAAQEPERRPDEGAGRSRPGRPSAGLTLVRTEASALGGPRPGLLDRHPAAAAAIGAVAARLLALAVAFATSFWLGDRLRHVTGAAFDRALQHPFGFWLSSWKHWDAVWFLRVAEHGYNHKSAAFFPLYPLTMRIGAFVVGTPARAGIVISILCLAGALVILYRLVRDEFDARTALWTVLLLSLAPTSLFFQAVYSESLFLFLTVASFAAGRRGHWLLAGLAGLLATATRSAGLLLLVPLVWMWFEQWRGRPIELPGSCSGRRLLAKQRLNPLWLGALALVPVGLGLYMLYLGRHFGDPLLFMAAQHHWHRTFHMPWVAVIDGARHAWNAATTMVTEPHVYLRVARLPFLDQWLVLGNLTAFLGLLLGGLLLVASWRRLPAAYTLFALVSLLLPLAYPTHATPLLSMPRFVVVDFPLFIALAVVVARRPVLRWVILGSMSAGLVFFTTLFANGMWVA